MASEQIACGLSFGLDTLADDKRLRLLAGAAAAAAAAASAAAAWDMSMGTNLAMTPSSTNDLAQLSGCSMMTLLTSG